QTGETFNKKIRNAVTRKVPNIWVIGNREKAEGAVTWRRYCTKDQISVDIARAHEMLKTMRGSRLMDNFPDVQLPG
ncbi:MAG TPA: His/Gly/Thr/Pro-type tRNA ligase C-terminal domain-containing protein, partial [Candidatus Hydrogenedentes bacterium]|nr:His/Gly/Thr/Pro-type tRNA ligase C-terminal domain-containing protein [Candidatus Hydrogenedentota bacterium]